MEYCAVCGGQHYDTYILIEEGEYLDADDHQFEPIDE